MYHAMLCSAGFDTANGSQCAPNHLHLSTILETPSLPERNMPKHTTFEPALNDYRDSRPEREGYPEPVRISYLLRNARCSFLIRHGLPPFLPPLPSGTVTSLGIKAFSRFRCLPVRLPNPPDLRSLPTAVFYR
jgi:hypothetical protein